MNLIRTIGLGIVLASALLAGCSRQPEVLLAAKDFPDLQIAGFAPGYVRSRGEHMVVSVDADKTGYEFGAAQAVYSGESGVFDVRITTLGDGDGASTYKLAVNGQERPGKFTQPQALEVTMTYTWPSVSIGQGDTIRVMFNGSDSAKNAGGKGPAGFHMGHGRWISLLLIRR